MGFSVLLQGMKKQIAYKEREVSCQSTFNLAVCALVSGIVIDIDSDIPHDHSIIRKRQAIGDTCGNR
jgi:hypothetical protein